jgi:alpha-L-arabinofuranosidase
LIQTADIASSNRPRLFATASRDRKTDTLIIKAVNPGAESIDTQINLSGLSRINSKGEALILSGALPSLENTFARTNAVALATNSLSGVSAKFRYEFKPYSATVLRLGAER